MGGVINKIWWGGDPDVRDSDTGLSRRDVYNIQKSWTTIYAHADVHGMKLFLGLFKMDPPTKTYFKAIRNMDEEQIRKSYQFKAHVLNLMSSFNTAVTNLNQPPVVIALMNKLGETHRARKVEVKHFDEVKIVLVEILKEDLKATDDVIESWGRFIEFIYKYIFEKLCESEPRS